MSQGERGLPGLPGDVVSTENRPIEYKSTGLGRDGEYSEVMD